MSSSVFTVCFSTGPTIFLTMFLSSFSYTSTDKPSCSSLVILLREKRRIRWLAPNLTVKWILSIRNHVYCKEYDTPFRIIRPILTYIQRWPCSTASCLLLTNICTVYRRLHVAVLSVRTVIISAVLSCRVVFSYVKQVPAPALAVREPPILYTSSILAASQLTTPVSPANCV